ncbi:hypothetical protein PHYBLDRAFT_142359 [Phycomyces blakesleeanus NRRL 1555(-)]|uniref:Uncharacterized protein n=1 Tax=Phycomyces blakesleeanus (strain ATCC 8743b / DSM 1359 / FGSC 10004 / NBRC 33097 / NRRL 1555) TaxID=763407 RepID=A0A167NXY5_PHYB8|nr:hypothetical protein PHYBLDRAFT_142359 [Phycomyces blakesleeanus NRRL 1555(-)]OAD76854.1 hypothetical protein PHYBLDRAFT_142359 [Phycomyces blakesleeanus NRRL 1555(-)]|eukprot:XP_018294894.1 hypothetical protein PHYBLDRAFT_142359 [Phycomyces blakesleeanus NRRL 1555(-)]
MPSKLGIYCKSQSSLERPSKEAICEIEYKEIVFDYKDVQGLSEEVTSAVYFNQLIRWCESADKLVYGTYQNNSRTTK